MIVERKELITDIPKTTINEFIEAFADLGMKITRVVSNQYNQICLSKVYSDEYENTNRIYIDFIRSKFLC